MSVEMRSKSKRLRTRRGTLHLTTSIERREGGHPSMQAGLAGNKRSRNGNSFIIFNPF